MPEPSGFRDDHSRDRAAAACTDASLREAVVREARTWLGTRYHHMGRVKGAGVDCATLLAEVYERAGAVPHVAIAHYPPDWHLHRDLERYLAYVLQVAHEVLPPLAMSGAAVATIAGGDRAVQAVGGPVSAQRAEPGDIVLYKWGRCFAHGAIITKPWPEEVIHAYAPVGAVTAGRGDEGRLRDRETKFFSVFPAASAIADAGATAST